MCQICENLFSFIAQWWYAKWGKIHPMVVIWFLGTGPQGYNGTKFDSGQYAGDDRKHEYAVLSYIVLENSCMPQSESCFSSLWGHDKDNQSSLELCCCSPNLTKPSLVDCHRAKWQHILNAVILTSCGRSHEIMHHHITSPNHCTLTVWPAVNWATAQIKSVH